MHENCSSPESAQLTSTQDTEHDDNNEGYMNDD